MKDKCASSWYLITKKLANTFHWYWQWWLILKFTNLITYRNNVLYYRLIYFIFMCIDVPRCCRNTLEGHVLNKSVTDNRKTQHDVDSHAYSWGCRSHKLSNDVQGESLHTRQSHFIFTLSIVVGTKFRLMGSHSLASHCMWSVISALGMCGQWIPQNNNGFYWCW